MSGILYLVPTPIGNLGDISQRMAEALEQADFIAAEDTRVSVKLLNHLGLKKQMVSYYRHNTETSGPAILALAASGQPTGRFTFEGFLAMNKKNRRRHLESLRGEERTMIFYEAPHKLAATLADLAEAFGRERPVSLCRELTKLHEEIRRTTLGEAADYYAQNPPKGEFVLVVRGAEPPEEPEVSTEDGLERVGLLREEGLSLRDAVKRAAKELGLSRNELYSLALEQDRK